MTRHKLRIGRWRVTYREAGNGPPVVVIPGLGLSGRFYDRSYAAFANAGLRLVVPDLPGFGGTRGGARGHDVAEAREFLLSFADALQLARCVWVGHSVGAQAAVELAAAAPHRARGLVLVGPTGSPGNGRLSRQAWALLREAARAPFPVVLKVLSDYARISPFAYVGSWLRYAQDRPLEKLRAVACPALVLVGTRDPIVDPLFLDLLVRRLPQARLERVAGGTHALPRGRATEFNNTVVSFCRELQEAAG